MAESMEVDNSVSWEKLPAKPLRLIAGRLPLRDFIMFRLVCKAWKTAARKCYRPYLVGTDGNNVYPPMLYSIHGFGVICFDQSWTGVRFVGSSNGWLIASKTKPWKCFLVNIFSKITINLPKWESSAECMQFCLSSSPRSTDCEVLLMGISYPGFAFCKLGDTAWRIGKCSLPKDEKDQDFLCQAVSLEGELHVLSHQGRLAFIDHLEQREDLTLVTDEIVKPWKKVEDYRQYLIESKGEIHVVFLCSSTNSCSVDDVGPIDHVEVFKFDYENTSWTRVYDLDGRIFCVGRSCCFSVSAQKVGWKGDLIYFTDTGREMWATYNMKEQRIQWEAHDGAWPWPLSNEYECTWLLPTFYS